MHVCVSALKRETSERGKDSASPPSPPPGGFPDSRVESVNDPKGEKKYVRDISIKNVKEHIF